MRFPWSDQPWRRAAVYGLGASGRAAVALLRRGGVAVAAWDDRAAGALDREALGSLADDSGVTLHLGTGDAAAVAAASDGVVVSPGVPADRPLLAAARRCGLPVIGEVELAFAQLDAGAGGADRVIAVTGSNGKSTTTALAGALLDAAGRAASVCGNFGPPLAGEVTAHAGGGPRVFVVELSSFQLESVDTFRPAAAALLNLSPDHIDRHGDLGAYLAAKARIFARQRDADTAVLNGDDPRLAGLAVRGRRRLFSRRGPVADGCYLAGGEVVEAAPGAAPASLFAVADLPLAGTHNLENAMAAALLARSLAVDADAIRRGLRAFRGLPHRLEAVVTLGGVCFFDDSKGTNVGATVASLEGFDDGSVHLILGGRAKGADFGALLAPVRAKGRRLYLIGEAADELAAALAPAGVEAERCGDLERAVAAAARAARAGESVVLSPACASFDQFTGFAHRGKVFQRLVRRLAGAEEAEHGA